MWERVDPRRPIEPIRRSSVAATHKTPGSVTSMLMLNFHARLNDREGPSPQTVLAPQSCLAGTNRRQRSLWTIFSTGAMLVTTLWLPLSPSRGDTPHQSSDPAAIAALIKQLRAPSFQARVQAEADCRQTGAEMLPALIEALRSEDPELRRRSQVLIERIEDDELTESIDAFLIPGSTSTLPGWSFMTDLVDDTPEFRAAYAEILQGNIQLSRALARPHLISKAIQREIQDMSPTLGSVPSAISCAETSALLLLLVYPDAAYSDDVGAVASRYVQSGVGPGVNETPSGRLLQALATRWVATPRASAAPERLAIATSLRLPEQVIPAMEMIQQKANPHQLNHAFASVARYGDAVDMSVIETLLNDRFELHSTKDSEEKVTSSCQLRDLALATLIELTQQDPVAYGWKPFPRDSSKNITSLPVAFESDLQRDAAFEKWQNWSRAHLRKFWGVPANAEEGTRL